MPPKTLLEQLRAAGVNKTLADDTLTEQDKTKLLDYLRKSHGAADAKNKITLTRKQTSEIKKADSSGKARTIQVEVRKKRVFVKREAGEGPAPAVAEAPPAAPTVDVREAELREQESRRDAELAARQAAELAERQERERRETEKREAEQRAAEEAARAASAGGAPPGRSQRRADTTLHKPKTAEAAEKKAKKPAKQVTVWRDETAKKRAIKTRGDATGGTGWHTPKGGRHRHADEAVKQAAGPAEPVVREIHGPGNDHRRRSRPQDVGQGRRGHQGPDEARPDGDDQPGARSGDGDDRRRGDGAQGRRRQAHRPGGVSGGGGAGGERGVAAAAGRHRDGSRRPRQDLAPRLHPAHEGRGGRGGRYHAAHRRLSRDDAARHRHVPRHARPRGVHVDARARGEDHRPRDPRRRRRRRRDAADDRGDFARQGGRRPDRGRAQQDGQARGESRSGQAGARHARCRPRGVRRGVAVRPGLGEDRQGNRRVAGAGAAAGGGPRAEGAGRCGGQGCGDRSPPGQGARSGGDRPRAERHAQARRRDPCRRGLRPRARDAGRERPPDRRSRAVDPGRDPGAAGRPERRRRDDGARRRAQGARDRAVPPGQVPRREAREEAGGEAREHVRADEGRGGQGPRRSSSRPTSRARRRRSRRPCRGSRPRRSRSTSFTRASAPSPSRT